MLGNKMKRSYILRYERLDASYKLVMLYGDMEIVIGVFEVFDDATAAQAAMEKSHCHR